MTSYDYLIVGSGLFGATFAHLSRKAGKRCLVIDKRHQLGGNVYCEQVAGINVHQYGPHIFHTSNPAVWSFVNGLVPFNRFTNCPKASYKGRLFDLPFNMNTFAQLWGVTTPEAARNMVEKQRAEVKAWLGEREPSNLEEQALCMVGRDLYEMIVKGYTEKQWGRSCRDLPAFIIRRLPIRYVFDNNYYDDVYQGVPIGGYNKLIEKLLEGVETRVDCDFFANRYELVSLAEKVVYTGPIDRYFDFCYGHLNYRTVSFEQITLDVPNYQGNAVINYTDLDVPYTRIIEHKHFEMFGQAVYDCPKTVVTREYSTEWKPGMEPFYPLNDAKNNEVYLKYKSLAECEKGVVFGGRLAEYKYYDMAPVIERAMEMSHEE